MAIDSEWTRRGDISLYLLHRLIHVSLYLPGLMQHCIFYALFSAASNGTSAAFVSARSLDKMMCSFTDDLTSIVGYH